MVAKKTYYISLNRKSVLDAYEWEQDENNYENGARYLNLFPAQIDFYEKGYSADNPYPGKIEFVQAGNSYGPEIDSSDYSSFGVEYLFERGGEFDSLNFSYSEVVDDARKEYAERHNLDVDEINDRRFEEDYEHAEALEEIENEYLETALEYNKGILSAALKDELEDENKGIVYKIMWYDDELA